MTGWGGRRAQQIRARWAARLPVPCLRCGHPVTPDQPWDVGHLIPKRDAPELQWDWNNTRPEHRGCNRSAGARIVAPTRPANRRPL